MLVCFIGWLWIGACLREWSSSMKLSKLGRLAMPSQQLSWVAFMKLWIQSLLLFYVEWLTICQVTVLFATWNWSLFLFGVYFHLGCVILFILSALLWSSFPLCIGSPMLFPFLVVSSVHFLVCLFIHLFERRLFSLASPWASLLSKGEPCDLGHRSCPSDS